MKDKRQHEENKFGRKNVMKNPPRKQFNKTQEMPKGRDQSIKSQHGDQK